MMTAGSKGGRWRSSRVAVLYGGESEERSVSLKTGEAFHSALSSLGYQVELVDATSQGLVDFAKDPPDVALLALHGGGGENGSVQGLLECLQVPYTGSGVLGSALAMNKTVAKRLFRHEGLPTPDWVELSRKEVSALLENGAGDIRLPCVVKPLLGGSSFGVTLVRDSHELEGAFRKALESPGAVLVEDFVEGRELTVGLMDGQVMGIIEVTPGRDFYDFEAKYEDTGTVYKFPAPISSRVQDIVTRTVVGANDALGCRGVVRVDLMLDTNDQPWLLEVNTTPGMTETSLVPKIASGAGLSFGEFTEILLERAALDSELESGLREP
jgi:D-alanine-D-alanine ligase